MPALAGMFGAWLLLSSGILAGEVTEPAVEQGPFTERNQFPFNLLFLAFPARGGSVLAPHAKELLVVTDYANTFTGSGIFTSFTTDERVRLTPSSVDTAQSMQPGDDLFFVDTEQDRTALIYRWGAFRHIEVDVEIPFLSYRGGMFDPAIEWYHRNLGLANGGRDLYDQDIVQMVLTLDNDEYFADRAPSTFEIGDVALFGRIALADSPRGAVALSLGVKLPTGDAEHLGGSGSLDAGIESEGTLRWGRQRLHGSAGWVHAGNWSLFPKFKPCGSMEFRRVLRIRLQPATLLDRPAADSDQRVSRSRQCGRGLVGFQHRNPGGSEMAGERRALELSRPRSWKTSLIRTTASTWACWRALPSTSRGRNREAASWRGRLFHRKRLIRRNAGEDLHLPRRPPDLHFLRLGGRAETEVEGQLVLGKIRGSAAHLLHLFLPTRRHRDLCPDGITIGAGPREPQAEVVFGVAPVVSQQHRPLIAVAHRHVQVPVGVDVGKGHAPSHECL